MNARDIRWAFATIAVSTLGISALNGCGGSTDRVESAATASARADADDVQAPAAATPRGVVTAIQQLPYWSTAMLGAPRTWDELSGEASFTVTGRITGAAPGAVLRTEANEMIENPDDVPLPGADTTMITETINLVIRVESSSDASFRSANPEIVVPIPATISPEGAPHPDSIEDLADQIAGAVPREARVVVFAGSVPAGLGPQPVATSTTVGSLGLDGVILEDIGGGIVSLHPGVGEGTHTGGAPSTFDALIVAALDVGSD